MLEDIPFVLLMLLDFFSLNQMDAIALIEKKSHE